MKLLLVLSCLLFASAFGSPTSKKNDPRWSLIPNDNGQIHLADLQSIQEDIEPTFNVEEDVEFLLFTRLNAVTPHPIFLNDADSIRNSHFNPNLPVKILVHGWTGSLDIPFNRLVVSAYLRRGDFNVIVVDWGVGAATINYVTARNRVPIVGEFLSRFVDFLDSSSLSNFPQITLIGNSLGAHITGVAGKRVTRGRLPAIIAIDPAGVLFSLEAIDTRFDRSDAIYTEQITTNCGTLGFCDPLGHSAFYPNGGRSQPGCGIDITGQCAHDRAFEFFAESINNNSFWSTRCANFAQIQDNNCVSSGSPMRMGGEPTNPPGTEGVFALTTNAASPFSRG